MWCWSYIIHVQKMLLDMKLFSILKILILYLSNTDNKDPSGCCIFERFHDVFPVCWHVSRSIALQDKALNRWLHEMGNSLSSDGGEHSEQNHIPVEPGVSMESVDIQVCSLDKFLH